MLSSPGLGQGKGCLPSSQGRPQSALEDSTLWSAFWQEFCLENVPHERCHIPGPARAVVDRHWAHFAQSLGHGAQLIDLGCGAGILGRLLLGRRPDLRITGVDFADVPTPAVDNLTIHPWVSMEALPFDDECFDGAISLFGIEYGSIEKTARQLARVLKPGARFSFLLHHRESEIVCEGATRRRALRELLSGKMRAPFLAGRSADVDQNVGRLGQQFPGEPSIKLFSKYLRRNVARNRAERHVMWRHLLDGLNPEIALLALLQRSAKAAPEMGAWLVPLLSLMKGVSVSVLHTPSGQPIAWQVSGIR